MITATNATKRFEDITAVDHNAVHFPEFAAGFRVGRL